MKIPETFPDFFRWDFFLIEKSIFFSKNTWTIRNFYIGFSMKIFDFQKKTEKFWLQIFKINFRHEKIIFFLRIFSNPTQFCPRNPKKYLENSAMILKRWKIKAKKVLTEIRDIPRYSLPTLDPATIYRFLEISKILPKICSYI